MNNTGKCPYCGLVITELEAEAIVLKRADGSTQQALTCVCPKCKKVLGVTGAEK